MTENAYPEWSELLAALTPVAERVALIGANDTGKTTLAALLAGALSTRGPVGVINSDVGQSDIGPPGCIGLGLVEAPAPNLGQVAERGLHLVGVNSPAKNPSGCIAGCVKLAARAEALGAASWVVDTSGFVHGPGARLFLLSLLDVLAPTHIVALQRENEIHPLIEAVRRRAGWQVHVAATPAAITLKPPRFRAQRRKARLMLYFQNARRHKISLDEVSLVGARFGTGEPLTPEQLTEAERLTGAAYEAGERAGGALHLVSPEPLRSGAAVALERRFRAEKVHLIDPRLFRGVMVGLTDFDGHTYAAGLIEQADLRSRVLHLLAPVRSVEAVRWLQVGLMRVTPDGRELAENKPWQI